MDQRLSDPRTAPQAPSRSDSQTAGSLTLRPLLPGGDLPLPAMPAYSPLAPGGWRDLLPELGRIGDKQITAAYNAARQGRTSALPELPAQHTDLALWQATWLKAGEAGRQAAFWRDTLPGSPARLTLPA